MPPARTGYSATQIALHWVIAVLVVAQVVLHEGMHAAYREARGGPAATEAESLMADLTSPAASPCSCSPCCASALRLRRGAPPPPAEERAILRFAARAVHFGFYAIILLMPLTGALAWFGGVEASAAVHRAGMLAIFVLLLLHVAGALYQHFVLKTDVMRRMLRPEKGG